MKEKKVISTYQKVNLTLLFFTVYCLSLPIISPIMSKIIPSLWQCNYKRITGKPCPLCGVTRDFKTILSGNNEKILLNNLSIFLLVIVLSELIFRLTIAINFKISHSKKTVLFDIIIHTFIILTMSTLILEKLYSQ